jgi:transposase InsO family protein
MNPLALIVTCVAGWRNRHLQVVIKTAKRKFVFHNNNWDGSRGSHVFTKEFALILRTGGIQSVRPPPRSPILNAYAERFVRTIKECRLDRMVLIGEATLHRAASHFVLHYHVERNHQRLENEITRPELPVFLNEGDVCCRKRAGRLLRCYYREAAETEVV